MAKCDICGTEADIIKQDYDRLHDTHCPRCGRFIISTFALTVGPFRSFPNWRTIVSYYVRNHQNSSDALRIDLETLKNILETTKLPSRKEQTEILLEWLSKNIITDDGNQEFDMNSMASIIGVSDSSGVGYIINLLSEAGLVKTVMDSSGHVMVSLTLKGLARVERMFNSDGGTCFMAMQYNDKVLDRLFNSHFKSAVKKTGFNLIRLDENLKAGLLDDQLRDAIKNAKFLLADLTHGNNGAYWEAGYAEGLGKPVIYLCNKEQFNKRKTHFDTNHLVTIVWDEATIEEDMENLINVIKKTLRNEAVVNN